MTKRTILAALLCSFPFLAPAFAQEPTGWRTDGTGRYPKTEPPKVWGLDKNVVWKARMPDFSVATPVIVGDKIFTCSDPTSLICVNKADGKILWEQKSSRDELPWTTDEREKLKDEQRQDGIWAKEQQQLEKQANALEKLRKDETQIEKANALRKEIDQIRSQANEFRNKRKTLPILQRTTNAPRHGTAGYSQCTPVTDGNQIFVMYGNGLVACHDLDGKRRWLKFIEHNTAAYGHGSSPTLVAGKLLVHFADLVALDIKDGAESWRLKIPPLHGTSIPTRIDGVDVVFTPTGHLIRVADGKILADQLGRCGENSPILHEGIAYYIAGNSRAVKIPASPTDKIVPLWKGNVRGGGYWFASPIYHDGLIYALSASGPFSVLDAKTGKLVYDIRHEMQGDAYPSVCLAGNLLYVSTDKGATIVLEPGREYKEIARNQLETFRSTPVFEGRRMYIRTQKNLWCIGE